MFTPQNSMTEVKFSTHANTQKHTHTQHTIKRSGRTFRTQKHRKRNMFPLKGFWLRSEACKNIFIKSMSLFSCIPFHPNKTNPNCPFSAEISFSII